MRHFFKKLKRDAAIHIITLPPLSIYLRDFLPDRVWCHIRAFDVKVQSWALAQSDNFTKKNWASIQVKKLETILSHAEKLPFWKNSFGRRGTRRLDISDFKIVSRADLKQFPIEALTASSLASWRKKKARTSGSTGEPLFFYQDERDSIRREANTFEEMRYVGALSKFPILILGLSTHTDLDSFGTRFSGEDLEDYNTRVTKIYAFIKQSLTEVLIGTPSLIERFVYFLRMDGEKFEFKSILYRGEHLTNSAREKISSELRGKISTVYGTRECSLIGLECSFGNIHTVPWMNLTEIVSNGVPVGPDQDGDIVITLFENEVMPFIRYRIGDRGQINSKACLCKRNTLTITFQGRDPGGITLPSGRFIHILGIINKLSVDFNKQIERFQLEKRGEKFVVRFIPTVLYSEKTQELLMNYLDKQFNNEIMSKLEKVEALNVNAQDKIPLFITN